jgi:hypothetical protein
MLKYRATINMIEESLSPGDIVFEVVDKVDPVTVLDIES